MSRRAPRRGLRLDIGELHLHGFAPEHRERFTGALHAALREMLRAEGPPRAGGLPPAPIAHLRHDSGAAEPEDAARETARALWSRIAPAQPAGSGG